MVADELNEGFGGEEDRGGVVVGMDTDEGLLEQIFIKGLQVFADTTTGQDLEMIPLSELPTQWDRSETFDTPPQNL